MERFRAQKNKRWKNITQINRESLHTSQVAHHGAPSPGFRSMKRLEILPLPPGWDASPSQG